MPGAPAIPVEDTEVVVVGARCAGSATAAAFARAGVRVVLLEASRFPSDTLSTHLLWPGGVAELARLGALDRVTALGAPPLRTAYAAGAGHTIRSPFAPVDGIDYALCVRRTGLDAALAATAVEAGADLREGARVGELLWRGERCAGVRYADASGTRELRAALVVGADGRRSTVARLAGAARPRLSAPSGRDCYFAYWRDTSGGWREVAAQWRDGPDLGTAFPCDNGLLLALVQPPSSAERPGRSGAERRYREAIERIPGLADRLAGCERVGRVRSATGLVSYFRRSSGPGWALPGDAGHFKDPVTAQGIRDALHYGRRLGELAAPMLHDPDRLDATLRAWESQRLADCLDIYQWTNRLARAAAMSPLEIQLYRRATSDPELARAVTAIFSRTRDPKDVFTPALAAALALGALRDAWPSVGPVLTHLLHEARDTAADWWQSRAHDALAPATAACSGDRHA
ncbi:2-polyprenyl-6-methoxyphenol hydroxylase [Nocardia amikacinitolerans]|uniref:NAD(P)/FAD-dependent oxidoreductase n=1 Tax=Nocardia amikacinitolerans TaxID=756689 RepID=UPI00082C0F1B|nr:FAD-dependent monooxygenase [Nocardia amikacinitolerans]MCP2315009.1 2-polyprenyl-6-methoxyphenol hydroxylase [Nocardia amikacinitolerans]